MSFRFDTKQMRSCAATLHAIAPPAYADAAKLCLDSRVLSLHGTVRVHAVETLAHVGTITTLSIEQIDHEWRALRYTAAVVELADGRADEQTYKDLLELTGLMVSMGARLAKGDAVKPADVALYLDLFGGMTDLIPALVSKLKDGGALGDAAEKQKDLDEWLKKYPAARGVVKALSAFTIVNVAAEQYRESAAMTDMGRVASALATAGLSGAIVYGTEGVGALLIAADKLKGTNYIDKTLAGEADDLVTKLEWSFTGDDRSVDRYEERARDWKYGPVVRLEQALSDVEQDAAELVDKAGRAVRHFVDDHVGSVRNRLGLGGSR